MNHIPVEMSKPLIIEFLGGPFCGKSLCALGLSYKLKLSGYNIEYVPERAKSLSWRDDMHTLSLQPYVTMKQIRDLYDLCKTDNKLEVIISDTSILLGLVYQDMLFN